MNKIIFPLLLLVSCQSANHDSQETVSNDSLSQKAPVLSKEILDSMYSHAYQVLNGDVAYPDYASAKETLMLCANDGDDRCQTLLGYYLVKGIRFEKDLLLGRAYLSKAVSSNNLDAGLYLSDFYYETGLVDSSILVLETLHQKGFRAATYILSGIYLKGTNNRLGRPDLRYDRVLNYEKGVRYLKHAAESETDAKVALANYYLSGIDGQLGIDTAKAIDLLKSVLKQHDIDSVPGLRDRVEMRLDEIGI